MAKMGFFLAKRDYNPYIRYGTIPTSLSLSNAEATGIRSTLPFPPFSNTLNILGKSHSPPLFPLQTHKLLGYVPRPPLLGRIGSPSPSRRDPLLHYKVRKMARW